MESLSLPPATLDTKVPPTANKSYGALHDTEVGNTPARRPSDWSRKPNDLATDNSPLLEALPVSNYQGTSFPVQHRASIATLGNSLGNSFRNSLSFKSIVNRMSPNTPPKKDPDVALHTLISAEEANFLSWLDGEYNKIETFYKGKESEAIERYLLLQDQLFNLREQKIAAKVAKAQDKPVLHMPHNATAHKLKKKIARKMELPSLPNSIQDAIYSHEARKSGNAGASRDYVKRKEDDRISYTVARRQLKIALGEYYRSLELLKSYRLLNQTAFRKMIKKFDKMSGRNMQTKYMEKVNSAYFCQSDVLDDLLRKTEDMYAMYFENGNHKHAVEKLRAKTVPGEYYTQMFITGLSYGLSIPLFIQAVVKGVQNMHNGDPDALFLFQIWGGFFLVLLFLCLFQINCLIWKNYKINYPFIFEFSGLSYLDAHELAVIPAVLMFIMCLFAWLGFYDFWPNHLENIHYPPIFLGIAVTVFLLPVSILQSSARKWLALASWRILFSGLYPVEFRDFFLGDIFCSLAYSISNASFFFCLYATHWYGVFPGQANGSTCGSSHSRILGFLNALPGIWRFLQCIRRYLDSGDWFPHLANMGKYGCGIMYYAFLSAYRIDLGNNTYRSLFIVFASINTIYSAFWDLFMDWSLMQESKNFLLRNELGFKSKWPYYTAMIIDPILRCNWIFYAIYANQVQQSAKVSFLVAFSEIIRRFIWVFFRIENEHCTNVVRFRASRDVTLPYAVTMRTKSDNSVSAAAGAAAAANLTLDGRPEDEEASIAAGETIPGTTVPLSRPDSGRPATTTSEPLAGTTPTAPGTTASTPGMRRTPTSTSMFGSIATPVLRALSSAMRTAHSRDFQRRKPSADKGDEGGIDSDDDDDDDDDMSSLHSSMSGDASAGRASSGNDGRDGPALRRRDTRASDDSFVPASTVKWRDQYL